jgi:hypothetical protein
LGFLTKSDLLLSQDALLLAQVPPLLSEEPLVVTEETLVVAHDSNRRGELGQNAFDIGQALLVIHAVGSFRP